MGAFSIWHWLIVLVVVLVLFGGGGKISRLMGDFGKGLKSFKKGMKEEESDAGDRRREWLIQPRQKKLSIQAQGPKLHAKQARRPKKTKPPAADAAVAGSPIAGPAVSFKCLLIEVDRHVRYRLAGNIP